MAGIQKFTSSLFIQSGSVARFESGLEVTQSLIISGVISASGYFDLEGNPVTGDITKEFFAGTSAGVSASNPRSEDVFIELSSGNNFTDDIVIHTTHSNTFIPNHYAFVKIEDEFVTKQSGSLSNYDVGSLTPGVYRYLVYGAKTGSEGETHQVYTTLFVKGFVNTPPNLVIPTAPILSIAHNENTGSVILHFTGSDDENESDAISFFTASKITPDFTSPSSTNASYTLVMAHSNFSGQSVQESTILATSSLDLTNHSGLKPYTNTLFFTASLSNYNVVGPEGKVFYENQSDDVEFLITLKDENEFIAENTPGSEGVTSQSLFVTILAPPTASIQDIRVDFETKGFSGIPTASLEHTLLYDKTESLNSASIAELDDKYTSSLVRISPKAKITLPPGYSPDSDYRTFIRINKKPSNVINFDEKITTKVNIFNFYQGEDTASSQGISFDINNHTPTESFGGFVSFTHTPSFSTNPLTESLYVGPVNESLDYINNKFIVSHSRFNHYRVPTLPDLNVVHFYRTPNVEVSNIVVEVESGSYGSNVGHPNLTSSLLYGYTASLRSPQTQSLLIDKIPTGSEEASIHPQYSDYISSSIVRLRVKAQITEPFGPDHKHVTFKLTGSNEDNSIELSHNFIFDTSSVYHSSSFFSNEDKPRLVANYTSSWHEFNFLQGVYNFTTHIISSSNANLTTSSISTAIVSMSNYSPVLLSDLAYETEHSGLTGSGINDANIVTSTTRQVLYGHDHSVFGNSSSYHNHPNSQIYASHSVVRMRVKGRITEPFGPATSRFNFDFSSSNSGDSVDPIKDAFIINTTSSNTFIDKKLITIFTSSLIGKDITFGELGPKTGSSVTTPWNLSGSVIFNSTSSFEGTGILSTDAPTTSTVTVVDTPATEFQFTPIETETFGESNIALTNPNEALYNHVSRSIRFSNEVSEISTLVIEDRFAKLSLPIDSSPSISVMINSDENNIHYVNQNIISVGDILKLRWYEDDVYNSPVYTETLKVESITEGDLPYVNFSNYVLELNTTSHPLSTEFQTVTTLGGAADGFIIKDLSKVETQETIGGYLRFTDPTGSGINNDLTGSSVTRFRTLVTITEPLGFLHFNTKIRTKFNKKNISSDPIYGPSLIFSTNSLDIFNSSSEYDDQTRLVVSYTSSFTGSALTSTPNNQYWETYITPGNVSHNLDLVHNPTGENGHNYTSIDSNSKLFFVVTGSDNTIKIEEITIQVESASHGRLTGYGSNKGHSNLTSSIMYGLTSSLFSYQTKSLIEDQVPGGTPSTLIDKYNSSSIIRFRLMSKVTEPFGSTPSLLSASFEGLQASTALTVTSTPSFTVGSASAAFVGSIGPSAADVTSVDLQIPQLGNGRTTGDDPEDFSTTFSLSSMIDASLGLSTIRITKIRLRGDIGGTDEFLDNVQIGGISIGKIKADSDNKTYFTNALDYDTNQQLNYPYTVNLTGDRNIAISYQMSGDVATNTFTSLRDNTDATDQYHNFGFGLGVAGDPNSFEIQIDFEYDVTEFTDEFTSQFFSPTFSFGLNKSQPTNNNVIGSVLSSSSDISENGLTKTQNIYTSSWVEMPIPTGSYEFVFLPFTFDTNSGYELSSSFDNNTTASVSMSDTPPTQLTDLAYQTETHGYIGSGSNDANITTDTERTVLYGDAHFTNATSESKVWTNHVSASAYASQSVSRFRVKGKIKEPFGPASCETNIELVTSSSQNVDINTFAALSVNTKSPNLGVWTIDSNYDSDDQRITLFTQSNFTENVDITINSPSRGAAQIENFIISGNVTYGIVDLNAPFPGENNLIIGTPITTSINVKDTPKAQITYNKIETETFGESNIGISNSDVNNPNLIKFSIFNGDKTLTTGSGVSDIFTASSVTRFRALLEITEPVGYLHHSASINIQHTGQDAILGTNIQNPFQTFSTSSSHILVSESGYTSENKLKVIYTSSFTGSELPTSLGPNDEHGFYLSIFNTVNAVPPNEYSFDRPSTPNTLYYVVSKSFSDVDKITVSNLKVQVEENHSGSGTFGNERFTNVLHGMLHTETNQIDNETYENSSSGSLVSVRIEATIEEPLQIIHNELPITVGGYGGEHIVILSTSSLDVASQTTLSSTGLKRNYISNPIPIALSASANTATPPTNDNAGRVIYEVSASIGAPSVQSDVTPDHIILSSLSHSFIHVTGALSSSTAITMNVNDTLNSNISSSGFGNYYVFGEHNTTNEKIKLFPTLNTTEPLFTSESNLKFPNNLSIDYSRTGFGATLTKTNGTASLQMNEFQLDDLTNVDKITLTTEVTDNEEGNGFNSTTTDIFVIPSGPQSMQGDVWHSKEFLNHTSLGASGHTTYRGVLTPDLVNFKPGDSPGDTVDNLFITSKSDGTGHNYSMSLSTPSNTTGMFSDSNSAYGYGDTGSLVVKINDATVVNVSLEADFDPSLNHTTQSVGNYNSGDWNNGTASFASGRLILNKVTPFNKVSQSISHGGINYPNGYQSWGVTLEIDSKLQDGYNKIDFEHIIFPGIKTHSLNTFDWYYDQGLKKPVINAVNYQNNITWATFNNVPATHSLSGVSYFLPNTTFLTNFNDKIHNLAHDTYYDTTGVNVGGVTLGNVITSPLGTLQVATGSNSLTSNDINHLLVPSNGSLMNGLKFNELDFGNPVASASFTASIKNIQTSVPSVDSITNDSTGSVEFINYKLLNRTLYMIKNGITIQNERTASLPVGRFAPDVTNHVNYQASTTQSAFFFDENYRWTHKSMFESGNLNPGTIGGTTNDYLDFWLNNNDYDSTRMIAPSASHPYAGDVYSHEAQQTIIGELQYPYTDYTKYIQDTPFPVYNPNFANYDTASLLNEGTSRLRRYYSRAFHIADASEDDQFFIVEITSSLGHVFETTTDISTFNNFGDLQIKLPGPQNNSEINSGALPGTAWGEISSRRNYFTSVRRDKWFAVQSFSFSNPLINSIEHYGVRIRVTLKQCTLQSKVVLFRARLAPMSNGGNSFNPTLNPQDLASKPKLISVKMLPDT